MPQVKFSRKARQDLRRLQIFIEEKSPEAARRMKERLLDGLSTIAVSPNIGRAVVPEENIREWPIKFGNYGYVVLYTVETETLVYVLAIKHQLEAGYFS